jgi:hypothetical protein
LDILSVSPILLVLAEKVWRSAMSANGTSRTLGDVRVESAKWAKADDYGGMIGETVVVTLAMRDGMGNIKNDTIKFVCVTP